jgi:hypothetical protein
VRRSAAAPHPAVGERADNEAQRAAYVAKIQAAADTFR